MASFRFELNSRPTRNKTYVVYLRITVGGKRKLIKTTVELARPSDFNAKCKGENWVRSSARDSKVLNAQLADFLAKVKETYRELNRAGEVTTVTIAKEMNKEISSPSFVTFAREQAQIIYDNGGLRNWKKYCSFINKLEMFLKNRQMSDVTLADITVDLVSKFDHFLHKLKNQRDPSKLLHPNTIEVQLNVMRSLVHKAIELGIMEPNKNPFIVFKYKGVKTVKGKLEESEIERIINLELEEGSLEWHCKNYFLFSYYCAGIRAADLIQMRWINITASGRLHYQMDKNHKDRDLLLVEPAVDILRYYHREGVNATDYIFPLLSNDAEYAEYITLADKDRMNPDLRKKMYQDISSKNALINKYLKRIAKLAKIVIPLSMHISRHSFAHIAQESGVESAAIKDILGHSNLATTERYMGSFDTSRTDETLRNVFVKNKKILKHEEESYVTKEEQAVLLLKSMTPEQISAVISAINK